MAKMVSERRAKEALGYAPVTEEVIDQLKDIVGSEFVSNDMEDLLSNTLDHSLLAYSQWQEYRPEVVVVPQNTEQVSQVVSLAARERIPITPRGGCTGFSGSAVPHLGGIALDMKRMDKIIRVDGANLQAIVQPGITNLSLAQSLRRLGYAHPHDPGSAPSSTIGGGASTSGVGYTAPLYGPLTRNIISLEVVLPDGTVVRLGPGTSNKVKSSIGYDLKSLFVGSFGTLGVITELTLRIYKSPEVELSGYRVFDHFEAMVEAMAEISRAELPGLKFLIGDDDYAIRLAAELEGKEPLPIEGFLLYSVASYKEVAQFTLSKIEEICSHFDGKVLEQAIGPSHEVSRSILDSWYDVFPRTSGHKKAFWHAEDIAVPVSNLLASCRQAREILQHYNLQIGTAHDIGFLEPTYAVYGVIFFADEKYAMEHFDIFEKANSEIVRSAIELGGSASVCHGHSAIRHGVEVLQAEMGPALDIMVKIKKAIDPHNIMNPTAKCFNLLL